MGVCVPVRDMKDTAAFAKLVRESSEPIIVTKNGYSEFVVMRAEDYDLMREEVAKASYEEGDFVDGPAFVSDVREKYGL